MYSNWILPTTFLPALAAGENRTSNHLRNFDCQLDRDVGMNFAFAVAHAEIFAIDLGAAVERNLVVLLGDLGGKVISFLARAVRLAGDLVRVVAVNRLLDLVGDEAGFRVGVDAEEIRIYLGAWSDWDVRKIEAS